MSALISGGISGAITNPDSPEALRHANNYYNFIRSTQSDIVKISQNTRYTKDQISLIKDYLFLSEHDLEGGRRRFDASFEIAESWRRLAFDFEHVKPHDFLLLKHELLEIQLVGMGISQSDAHVSATIKHNYELESTKYYEALSNNQSRNKNISNEIISGAVNKINWGERY